jgi:hypothetical protein
MALLPLRPSLPPSRRKTVLTERPSALNSGSSLGLRPSQQLLRELGRSLHRLSLGDAPETSRIDLGRTKGTRASRRTPFATTSNAKEAVARAVGIVWEL